MKSESPLSGDWRRRAENNHSTRPLLDVSSGGSSPTQWSPSTLDSASTSRDLKARPEQLS